MSEKSFFFLQIFNTTMAIYTESLVHTREKRVAIVSQQCPSHWFHKSIEFRRSAEKLHACILLPFVIFRLHLEQSLKCSSSKVKSSESDDGNLIQETQSAPVIIWKFEVIFSKPYFYKNDIFPKLTLKTADLVWNFIKILYNTFFIRYI